MLLEDGVDFHIHAGDLHPLMVLAFLVIFGPWTFLRGRLIVRCLISSENAREQCSLIDKI